MSASDYFQNLEKFKTPSIFLALIGVFIKWAYVAHYYWTLVRKLEAKQVHLFYISLVVICGVIVIAVDALFVSSFRF